MRGGRGGGGWVVRGVVREVGGREWGGCWGVRGKEGVGGGSGGGRGGGGEEGEEEGGGGR